jgi:hypothetical protein
MDKSVRQQESDLQKPSGFLHSPQFFKSILQWLVGLIYLTEEEKKDAGIYLGD